MAVLDSEGDYRLHGYKWFSSATDANMAFALARVQDEEGRVKEVYIHTYTRTVPFI